MKKESFSKTMYKNSPKAERDEESGKMKVKKSAENETSRTAEGVEGMPEHDEVMKLHMKHAKERMEMHHKHEKEHLAVHHKLKKHEAEGSAEEEKSESKAEEAKEGD